MQMHDILYERILYKATTPPDILYKEATTPDHGVEAENLYSLYSVFTLIRYIG